MIQDFTGEQTELKLPSMQSSHKVVTARIKHNYFSYWSKNFIQKKKKKPIQMAKEQANTVAGKSSPALSCSRELLTLMLLQLFIHTHDKLDQELKEVKLTCQIK